MQMEPLPDDHARGESLKTKNTSAVQPSSTLKKYAKGNHNPITIREIKSIEKFFYSEYFMFLTDMPDYSECGKTDISLEPSCLLKFLRKEVLGDMDYDDLFKENNNVK